MQTFLPRATFAASAATLDSRRLGKQRVETLQILRALVWPDYGWKRHPAVLMWRGFTPALVAYGVAVCDEWRRRGHRDGLRATLLDFTGGDEPSWSWCLAEGLLPPWLGDDDLHLSHRSALLRKDPDHYRPLFPDVPDDLDYFWPGPVLPLDLPDTDGLVACRVDRPPLPDDVDFHGPPPPLDHRPGPSVARAPTEADLAAMRAEAADPHRVRFFRRGQRLPAPTSRFTLRVELGEKTSAAVSIRPGPRSSSQ
ncbi:hypothetical protein FHX81_5395 [Saccharothrix saharensis]|uniref:Uncharacterized protein n=1 Tax=Saccharothrix saharensis TaxID=571190 RepID=A0A543JJD9_9PSEU|nr:MSMEG_6728 family protein [Saccharothrix saharensis]TQM82982.1 hypothetical protein FHX81_5395 [Saccharothrix saharensis]